MKKLLHIVLLLILLVLPSSKATANNNTNTDYTLEAAETVIAVLSGDQTMGGLPFHISPYLLEISLHGHSLPDDIKNKLIDLGFNFSGELINRTRDMRAEASDLDQTYDIGIFRFHYTTDGDHGVDSTDNDSNTVPDYIDVMAETFVHVYDEQINAMGYFRPPGDGWLPEGYDNGGSDHYDIYVRNLSPGYYGYVQAEYTAQNTGNNEFSPNVNEQNAFTSYMAMRDNYDGFPNSDEIENIQVTAAHEFFHAIQYGYDGYEKPWLLEATAVWVEEEVYDEINDCYQYMTSWFNEPQKSLDHSGGTHWYGSWIFFEYIDEHLGGSGMIENIFVEGVNTNSANGDYSHQAIDDALSTIGSSFQEALNGMAIANRVMSPEPGPESEMYSYEEAEDFPVDGPSTYQTVNYSPGDSILISSTSLNSYASQYIVVNSSVPFEVTLTNISGPQEDLKLHSISEDYSGNFMVQSISPMNIDPAGYGSIFLAVVSQGTESDSWDFEILIEGSSDPELTSITQDNIQEAVDLWVSDQASAEATYGHISVWDVGAVTDMSNLFSNKETFNDDLSSWDVSSVTSTYGMFNEATNFNGNISSWDVSNIVNMDLMFHEAESFNQDIGGWDVSNVNSMDAIFKKTYVFNQDIGGWDVSSVTQMNSMFYQSLLFNQDIGGWDVSSVTNMAWMFGGTQEFNQDISGWDVSNVTDFWPMFSDAYGLSDENKCAIHESFSSNDAWPYDWSEFCEEEFDNEMTVVAGQVSHNGTFIFTFSDPIKHNISLEINQEPVYGHLENGSYGPLGGFTFFHSNDPGTSAEVDFSGDIDFSQSIELPDSTWITSHSNGDGYNESEDLTITYESSNYTYFQIEYNINYNPGHSGQSYTTTDTEFTIPSEELMGSWGVEIEISAINGSLPGEELAIVDGDVLSFLVGVGDNAYLHLGHSSRGNGEIIHPGRHDKRFDWQSLLSGSIMSIPHNNIIGRDISETDVFVYGILENNDNDEKQAWFLICSQSFPDDAAAYINGVPVSEESGSFFPGIRSFEYEEPGAWTPGETMTIEITAHGNTTTTDVVVPDSTSILNWVNGDVYDVGDDFFLEWSPSDFADFYSVRIRSDGGSPDDRLILFTSETSISVDGGSLSHMIGDVDVDISPWSGASPEYNLDGNIDDQYGFIWGQGEKDEIEMSFQQDDTDCEETYTECGAMCEDYYAMGMVMCTDYLDICIDECGGDEECIAMCETEAQMCFAENDNVYDVCSVECHLAYYECLEDDEGLTPITQDNIHEAVDAWYSNPDSTEAIYGHISDWDVSSVTNMYGLFQDKTTFNDDIGNWDVSNVTNMENLFGGWNGSNFNQDISNWDVSSVTNMGSMFQQAENFNQDISSWDVSSVTNMQGMFRTAGAFNQNLSNWDVSNVETMYEMFAYSEAFNGDISNWDVSSVTDMLKLFGYSNFNGDISNWDVSSVMTMESMFKSATSFNQDLSDWDVSSVTNMAEIFDGANSLSDENKCAIHDAFSEQNDNWPYDWSEFCDIWESPIIDSETILSLKGRSFVDNQSVVMDTLGNGEILRDIAESDGEGQEWNFSDLVLFPGQVETVEYLDFTEDVPQFENEALAICNFVERRYGSSEDPDSTWDNYKYSHVGMDTLRYLGEYESVSDVFQQNLILPTPLPVQYGDSLSVTGDFFGMEMNLEYSVDRWGDIAYGDDLVTVLGQSFFMSMVPPDSTPGMTMATLTFLDEDYLPAAQMMGVLAPTMEPPDYSECQENMDYCNSECNNSYETQADLCQESLEMGATDCANEVNDCNANCNVDYSENISNCEDAYSECIDGCEDDEECMVGCVESRNECIESSQQQYDECFNSCSLGFTECMVNLYDENEFCVVTAEEEFYNCSESCQEDYEECIDEDENSVEILEIFMVLHDYEEQGSGFQFTIESRTEEICENLDYSDCMETGCEWDDGQDECRHAWWVEYETSVDIYSFQFNIEAQFPDCEFQVGSLAGNGILGEVDMVIEFTYDQENQDDPIYISTITGSAGEGPNNYIPAGTSGLLSGFGGTMGGGNELCINNIGAQDSSGEEIESTSDQTCAIYKDGECSDDEWACFDDMPEPPEGEPTPEEVCDWINNVLLPSGTLGDCDWELLTEWGDWLEIDFPDCELDMCNAFITEEECSPTVDANDYIISISDTLDMLIAIGETVDCENLGESECSGEDFEDVNGNGVWDAGEPFVDLNGNGVCDEGVYGCDWDDDEGDGTCVNECTEAVEYIIFEIFESEIVVNFETTGSCAEPWEAFAPFLEEIDLNCSGLDAFSQAARNMGESGCVSWGGPAEDCEWISGTCESIGDMGGEVTVDHNSDWNLVGLPLEVDDPHYLTIFPDAVENTLFSFDLTYNLDTMLVNGDGYWLRFDEEGSTTITGAPLTELTITLEEDWNLISGIAETISVYSIDDPDGVIVLNTLFGFDQTYVSYDELVAGKGYWIRAYEAGEISIVAGALAKAEVQDFSLKGKANTLSINGSELYFGVELSDIERLSYSLPPIPPVGAFDARFKDGWRVVKDYGEIEVMPTTETLNITYDIMLNAGEHHNWVLSSETLDDYVLEDAGELTVPSAERFTLELKAVVPATFTLHQNFPNPFNPITTLRYDLPSDAFVTLTVYDMLGRTVAHLVNTTQEAGFRSVKWDATDSMGRAVSAGVYLYKIHAGEFVQTKKMVLLK